MGNVDILPARFGRREGGGVEGQIKCAYPKSGRGSVVLGPQPPARVVEWPRGVGARMARGEDEADSLLCGCRGAEDDCDDQAGYLEHGNVGVDRVRRDGEGWELNERRNGD